MDLQNAISIFGIPDKDKVGGRYDNRQPCDFNNTPWSYIFKFPSDATILSRAFLSTVPIGISPLSVK